MTGNEAKSHDIVVLTDTEVGAVAGGGKALQVARNWLASLDKDLQSQDKLGNFEIQGR